MDQALAVRNAAVSMAYREGVFHHGFYRDGDESWVLVSRDGGRFAQAGASFANARPRFLSLALMVRTGSGGMGWGWRWRSVARRAPCPASWARLGPSPRWHFERAAKAALSSALAWSEADPDDAANKEGDEETASTHDGPASTAASAPTHPTPPPAPPQSNATPVVAYVDPENGGKAVVKSLARDGSWPELGGGAAAPVPFSPDEVSISSVGASPGRVSGIQVAIDAGNTVYIAYRDGSCGDRMTVARFEGGLWRPLGGGCVSVDRAAGLSLALVPVAGSAESIPCASYGDAGVGGAGVLTCFISDQVKQRERVRATPTRSPANPHLPQSSSGASSATPLSAARPSPPPRSPSTPPPPPSSCPTATAATAASCRCRAWTRRRAGGPCSAGAGGRKRRSGVRARG